MASQTLYARLRRMEFVQPLGVFDNEEDKAGAVKVAKSISASAGEYVLIRIDEVMESLEEDASRKGQYFDIADWHQLPPMAFPFGHMWMECHYKGRRKCVLAMREDLENGWRVLLVAGVEGDVDGNARLIFPCQSTSIVTDGNGKLIGLDEGHNLFGEVSEDSGEMAIANSGRSVCFAAALAFAQLNCRNVRIEKQKRSTDSKCNKKESGPYVVWHQIVVDSAKSARSISQDSPSLPKEIRLHRVRGHFADYREKGLFGRVFGVFWIPEHEAGSAEIGIVQQSYSVRKAG